MREAIAEYWSRGAKGYNKSVASRDGRKGKKAWQDFLKTLFGPEKLTILDVGTGPGIMALLLAGLGHTVTGVDISAEMLAIARENAVRTGFPVSFIHSDAEELPFADESFDAVINRHLLWTLLEPEKALAEWKRVLKPQGKLVIIDGNWYPNLEGSLKNKIWRFLAASLVLLTEKRNPFVSHYSSELKLRLPLAYARRPEEDLKLLRAAGFDEVAVINGVNRLTQTTLEYLKCGYWGDTFCIRAVKKG